MPCDDRARRSCVSDPMEAASDAASILASLDPLGVHLHSEAPRLLVRALIDPGSAIATLLVAGTNGKGSTCALLASILRTAGYRTGLFTSPHLETVEECVRVNGRAVAGAELATALTTVLETAARGGLVATRFEALFVAALLLFSARRCDVAVLEAGMGGRGDATNAADPILSVLTSVGLDHREHLGSTLTAIAEEKAGILRPGRAAIVGRLPPSAEKAVREAADRIGARMLLARQAACVTATERIASGVRRIQLRTARRSYRLIPPLAGAHQMANLALAVLAAETLAAEDWARITPGAIARGVESCVWPGRMERVPLPGGRSVLLDAAHNPGGIAALVRELERRGEIFDLLFGVLDDKDARRMLQRIAARARWIWLTRPPGPRGLAADQLLPLTGRADARVEPDLDLALSRALAALKGTLVVCGSLLMVGEIRRRLRCRFGVPPPASDL